MHSERARECIMLRPLPSPASISPGFPEPGEFAGRHRALDVRTPTHPQMGHQHTRHLLKP